MSAEPTTTSDGWEPSQYRRFSAERAQPFHDLLALVEPTPGGRVVDLGCGTGDLTVQLHRHTRAASTIGIDNSPAMLDAARSNVEPGLTFAEGDISTFAPEGDHDVVFANASLQWIADHPGLLARLVRSLRPAGQLAVQVPANADHPSHTIATTVAAEEPFASAIGTTPPPDTVAVSVLAPEHYAELLHELGFDDQHVRLQVYGHTLDSTAEVVEWTRGTLLVRFRRLLPPALFEQFVERYRAGLLDAVGDQRPYFYAFKRILMWGRRSSGH